MFYDTFNYIYSGLGLKTENLKICYDFRSFDASTNNILSVKNGDSFYSGTVEGDFESFTGTVSGSGYFSDNHIKINNSSGLFAASSAFLFSQEKVDNSAGVVFSNYSGGSGFEFGINNANKLYFKTNYIGEPVVHTLNNIPFEKNVYGVSIAENSIGLLRYTPYDQKLESQSFDISSISITDNPNWLVGSGEYGYKGYLSNFVYMSQFVSNSALKQLSRSFHEEAFTVPAVTGSFSGLITGYQDSFTGISGEIAPLTGVTGYLTGSGGFSYTSGIAKTGCVDESGSLYLPFGSIEYPTQDKYLGQTFFRQICAGLSGTPTSYSGSGYFFQGSSGIYNGETGYCATGKFFGITGFEKVTLSGAFTGVTPLLGITGVLSGITHSGVTRSGLRGPEIAYTGTGAYTGFSGRGVDDFYPNSYVYVENRQPKYFVEAIGFNDGGSINQKAVTTLSPFTNEITFMVNKGYSLDELNITFNGISLLSGKSVVTRNQYNQTQISVNEDYFLTGDMFLFMDLDVQRKDEAFYDINQTGADKRTVLTITGTGDYANAPFGEINTTGTQVFLNGVKLYSGVSYYEQDGEFLPTGELLEITGTYFTYPAYTGVINSRTGMGMNGYFDREANNFVPNAHVFFVNGVRQDPSVFVEHSSGVDLLATGKQVFDRYFKQIYWTQNYGVE